MNQKPPGRERLKNVTYAILAALFLVLIFALSIAATQHQPT